VQGAIAQVVALVTWGNAALGLSPLSIDERFYPANTAFRFCESVRFASSPRRTSRSRDTYASDPADWFARLKKDDVETLRMSYRPSPTNGTSGPGISDRMSVGFVGGGGRWLIEAARPRSSDYWEAGWVLGDRDRADQKIWRVTYTRVAESIRSFGYQAPNVSELRDRLAAHLTEAAEFARVHVGSAFAEAFEAGRACLSSQETLTGIDYPDLAPPGSLPHWAEQFLAAAQAAWVFGGMGSWNDVWFEGTVQERYEALSEELYLLLNSVIVTAANSTSLPEKR
jgi:hypothetical protein